MAITPYTELDAVNSLLESIGETPINSLSGSNTQDVIFARNLIQRISKKMQHRGWHFNTEDEYPLAPTVDNEIILPQNTIRVDLPDAYKYDIIQLGSKLYDRKTHSFTAFTETLKVTIVLYREYEDLPEVARHYIIMAGTQRMQQKALGSETLSDFDTDDVKEAWRNLIQYDLDIGDYNILDNPTSQDIVRRDKFI